MSSKKRSPEEGLYSRVTRRIWKSPDFLALSKPKPSGRELWLRLLIAPESDRIPGLFEAYEGGIADAMQWPLRELQRCWREIESRKMAFADWTVGLVWVPNSLKHNFPANPNNVLGWRLSWKQLPKCNLRDRACVTMGDAFVAADEESPPKNGIGWAAAFAQVAGNVGSEPPPQTYGGNVPHNGGGAREREQEREREIPPAPLPLTKPGRPDPFAASFGTVGEPVRRVHEAWKLATGLKGHRLRGGATDLDSVTLAESIAGHGEPDCLLVAEACMSDRMVNGQADEKGDPHTSIRYVFGNEHAFARILKAAQDARAKAATAKASGDDAFDAAMEADAS